MATEVLIPKLGMTMTEGTVAEWLATDGANVQAGDALFRLETEKIEFQVEAESPGVFRQIVPAGTVLPPGSIVGYVLAAGESLPAGVATADVGSATRADAPAAAPSAPAVGVSRPAGSPVFASPIARRLAAEAGIDLGTVAGTGPGGRIVEADIAAARTAARRSPVAPASAPSATPQEPAETLASPVARRLAAQLGIELARVRGTGPGGRITKEDVEAAAAAPSPATEAARPAAAAGPAAGAVIPLRGMRKVIADRMHQSLQTMAQLTMGMEVTMDEAAKLREQLIAEWSDEGVRPSYTDLILRAVAKALRTHPLLNAEVTDAGVQLHEDVHLGMAVAVEGGLVVPVIRNAPTLTLRDLAVETGRLAAAARDGRLGPDDYAGGTFSVTSLGMADVDLFTPIINPPNVAILGVGRIKDAVRWDGDKPVRARTLTLSLTVDHRAVDGVPGAAFLRTVRDLLEAPYRLLV